MTAVLIVVGDENVVRRRELILCGGVEPPWESSQTTWSNKSESIHESNAAECGAWQSPRR